MASFSVSVYYTTVTFTVSGVTSGDSIRVYIRYANDASAKVSDVYYTASGTSFSTTYTLSPDTYTANVKINNDDWIGGKTFTTIADPSSRPADWSWSGIYMGAPVTNMTAAQWNSFTTRINEFRAYKEMSGYSFTTVVKGITPISAVIVNQARSAINEIQGHGALPLAAVPGVTKISAAFFSQLASALNAVT